MNIPSVIFQQRSIKMIWIAAFFWLIVLSFSPYLAAQAPKSIQQDIENASLHFSLDGVMSVEGNLFFDSLFKTNEFVILGEYHGSSEIGKLTEALLPIYVKYGGEVFGLEIGPVAADFITTGLEKQDARDLLRDVNTRYRLNSSSRSYTPIPFFSNNEDAAFLQAAKDLNLKLVGLDQEYIYSYSLLLELLLEKMVAANESAYGKTIKNLQDSLKVYQQLDMEINDGKGDKKDRLPIRFQESSFVQTSLEKLSGTGGDSKKNVEAIKLSNEIYYSNATGDWWNSNRLRTENFINNYRAVFVENDRIINERLFLKIGGLHAARGINNYSRYDVGNAIYETARLSGRQSCHIVVLDRYWMGDEGEVEDVLQDTSSWYGNNFEQLLQVAEPERWTIVNLEKIRKQGLYRKDVADRIREYFERYDVVLIPPADSAPSLNVRE